jgi:hypothetical protein
MAAFSKAIQRGLLDASGCQYTVFLHMSEPSLETALRAKNHKVRLSKPHSCPVRSVQIPVPKK